MALKIYQVDAFTDHLYSGNPAAVCLLAAPAEPDWMQRVAREMNLSETAFLTPHDHDGHGLRWFTPTVEVDLCGHATLASAHVLWSQGYLPPDRQARFHTQSGLLTADRRDHWIDLNFPAEREQTCSVPPELVSGLRVPVKYVGKNRVDFLVEVDSEAMLRTIQPNFDLLARVPARGIIVTALASTSGYDFVSRFFAPRSGVAEDPATGSAHCCLGPYWQRKLGKSDFVALQVSPRGGVLQVSVLGDRVRLSGQAVLVLRGELLDEAW